MDLKDLALLITALTGFLSAVLSGLAAVYAARADAGGAITAKRLAIVQTDVKAVAVATDGMKTALVKATGDAAFAAGKEDQRKNG